MARKKTKLRQSYDLYKQKYRELKNQGHAMREILTFKEYEENVKILKLTSSYKGKNYSKFFAEGAAMVSKSAAGRIRRILQEEWGVSVTKEAIIRTKAEIPKEVIEELRKKWTDKEQEFIPYSKIQNIFTAIKFTYGRKAANDAFGYKDNNDRRELI